MTDVIVDTNVIVVANRQNDRVVPRCLNACIEFVVRAQSKEVVLIDSGDAIRSEYAGALSQGRPYQLGAQFLMYIYQNQFNEKHVRRVELELTADGKYAAFPASPELQAFDQSDRKFAALSRVTGTPVTNAVDSDWALSLAALEANGIKVDFLCSPDPASWLGAE